MKVIVAVDRYWGIGAKNDLLFKLPMDMMRFRALTSGHTVLMGYNTLLSFPGGKPLKNRRNIVLAPEGVERDDCVVVHTLDELLALLKEEDTDQAFVVGGAMFYHTMLPYCKEALITKVDGQAGGRALRQFGSTPQLGIGGKGRSHRGQRPPHSILHIPQQRRQTFLNRYNKSRTRLECGFFCASMDYSASISSNQMRTVASEGIRQSPRGDKATVPTLAPSGMGLRLNCWEKKRI